MVPSKISDSVLAYGCKYRSKARIPALAYLHWANQASITRCSQPLVGLKNNRSNQDERLIEAIFTTHHALDNVHGPTGNDFGAGGYGSNPFGPSQPLSGPLGSSSSSSSTAVYGATATNLIVDARPTANAMANVATGAGTENMEYYKSARKAYLGIENIHVMRDSLKKVETALQKAESTGVLDRHLLKRSNWLKHISVLLDGTLLIVRNIHINSSHVLIHCSDGWDRTSQLSALAQICLDPYFRTIKGFQVLVEKDWVSFGHKFMDRCGFLSPDKLDLDSGIKPDDEDEERNEATRAAQALFGAFQKHLTPSSHHVKETSPVFHQFLDCIHQLQQQHPTRFEYNSKFLEDLYYHLYSCQFGTFIGNTEKARRTPGGTDEDGASVLVASKAPVCERTVSIWDFVNNPDQLTKYKNPEYDPSQDDATKTGPDGDMGVLFPNPKQVRFWSQLFKCGDEQMNGSKQFIQDQTQDATSAITTTATGDPVIDRDPETAARAAAILKTDESALLHSPVHTPARAESPGRSTTTRATMGDSWHNVESSPRSDHATLKTTVATSSSSTTTSSDPTQGTASPTRRTTRTVNPTLASGSASGSWGWSNFSSGALNVLSGAAKELSGAAKEIRTLGADAYTTFTAPPPTTATTMGSSEGGREGSGIWDRSSAVNGSGSGGGGANYPSTLGARYTRTGSSDGGESARGGWSNGVESTHYASGLSRPGGGQTVGRIPSESNPWATTNSSTAPLGEERSSGVERKTRLTNDLAKPAGAAVVPQDANTYLQSPAETWGSVADQKHGGSSQRGSQPMASSLTTQDTRSIGLTDTYGRLDLNGQKEDKDQAARDQKQSSSWDPLGAL